MEVGIIDKKRELSNDELNLPEEIKAGSKMFCSHINKKRMRKKQDCSAKRKG